MNNAEVRDYLEQHWAFYLAQELGAAKYRAATRLFDNFLSLKMEEVVGNQAFLMELLGKNDATVPPMTRPEMPPCRDIPEWSGKPQ